MCCHPTDNIRIKQVDINILNALNVTVYSKLMGYAGSHVIHSANIHWVPTICQELRQVVVI